MMSLIRKRLTREYHRDYFRNMKHVLQCIFLDVAFLNTCFFVVKFLHVLVITKKIIKFKIKFAVSGFIRFTGSVLTRFHKNFA